MGIRNAHRLSVPNISPVSLQRQKKTQFWKLTNFDEIRKKCKKEFRIARRPIIKHHWFDWFIRMDLDPSWTTNRLKRIKEITLVNNYYGGSWSSRTRLKSREPLTIWTYLTTPYSVYSHSHVGAGLARLIFLPWSSEIRKMDHEFIRYHSNGIVWSVVIAEIDPRSFLPLINFIWQTKQTILETTQKYLLILPQQLERMIGKNALNLFLLSSTALVGIADATSVKMD